MKKREEEGYERVIFLGFPWESDNRLLPQLFKEIMASPRKPYQTPENCNLRLGSRGSFIRATRDFVILIDFFFFVGF